jgi:hypothetical protein
MAMMDHLPWRQVGPGQGWSSLFSWVRCPALLPEDSLLFEANLLELANLPHPKACLLLYEYPNNSFIFRHFHEGRGAGSIGIPVAFYLQMRNEPVAAICVSNTKNS